MPVRNAVFTKGYPIIKKPKPYVATWGHRGPGGQLIRPSVTSGVLSASARLSPAQSQTLRLTSTHVSGIDLDEALAAYKTGSANRRILAGDTNLGPGKEVYERPDKRPVQCGRACMQMWYDSPAPFALVEAFGPRNVGSIPDPEQGGRPSRGPAERWTQPSYGPTKEIDYVFGSAGTVSFASTRSLGNEFRVGSAYLSDHMPIVTDVTITGPSPG